jgi:hypothetical protein
MTDHGLAGEAAMFKQTCFLFIGCCTAIVLTTVLMMGNAYGENDAPPKFWIACSITQVMARIGIDGTIHYYTSGLCNGEQIKGQLAYTPDRVISERYSYRGSEFTTRANCDPHGDPLRTTNRCRHQHVSSNAPFDTSILPIAQSPRHVELYDRAHAAAVQTTPKPPGPPLHAKASVGWTTAMDQAAVTWMSPDELGNSGPYLHFVVEGRPKHAEGVAWTQLGTAPKKIAPNNHLVVKLPLIHATGPATETGGTGRWELRLCSMTTAAGTCTTPFSPGIVSLKGRANTGKEKYLAPKPPAFTPPPIDPTLNTSAQKTPAASATPPQPAPNFSKFSQQPLMPRGVPQENAAESKSSGPSSGVSSAPAKDVSTAPAPEQAPTASDDVQERGILQQPLAGTAATPMGKIQPQQQIQQSAPPPPQPQMSQPVVPHNKPPGQFQPAKPVQQLEEARVGSIHAGNPKWITWGYLRTAQPEILGQILGDVNAGRLPRSAVAGVVPPAQLDTFLRQFGQVTTDLAGVAGIPVQAGPQQGVSSGGDGRMTSTIAGTAKMTSTTAAALKPALRFLPLQPAPDRMEFGSMLVGQLQTMKIRFMSPLDGDVRVSIADPAFRIRRLRSLTGLLTMQTAPVTLTTGAKIQATKVLATDTQIRTAPPWMIPVKSGQDVEIVVDVSPNPAVPLGEHSSQLRVDLTNSPGVSVPIHARLDGRLHGIGIDVYSGLDALPARDFVIPFEWVNAGEASEATLTFDSLPLGFTTPTPVQSARLEKGGRRPGAFVVNVSNVVVPNTYFLSLKLVNGPIRMTYGIGVTVHAPWIGNTWTARPKFSDGEEIAVENFLQIRSDGWFQYSGRISTDSTRDAFVQTSIYRYQVGVSLPGGFAHNVYGSFGHGSDGRSASTDSTWSESGNSPLVATNFIAASRGLGRAVAYPYIKVERSTF